MSAARTILTGSSYHINQRNEGIDLGGLSGALMRTQNMQMQTFVTQPEERSIAFAANQRDEVRDLHDVAGKLEAVKTDEWYHCFFHALHDGIAEYNEAEAVLLLAQATTAGLEDYLDEVEQG